MAGRTEIALAGIAERLRGQILKNPAGWSYPEAQGALRFTTAVVSGIRESGVISLYSGFVWGRGSFG